MEDQSSRKDFEKWISAPPIELSIRRNSLDGRDSAWPGQYVAYKTQLVWEAWKEPRRQLTIIKPNPH